MKAQNQTYQKSVNTTLVLRTLWFNHGITRAEIARKLGLDRSTVFLITNRLIKQGVVTLLDKAESTPLGGRKAMQLGLNGDYGVILGLELHPTSYNFVVLNLTGKIIFKARQKCVRGNLSFSDFFFSILSEIEQSIKHINSPIIGISLGMPGWVNTQQGVIHFSELFHLNDYSFSQQISSQFKIPVVVENDANCCAWGELLINRQEKLQNFIYLLGEFHEGLAYKTNHCKIGIGMGIVINGKVYYGNSYSAGEFKSVFWNTSKNSQFGLDDAIIGPLNETGSASLSLIIEELLANLSVIIAALNPGQIIIGGDLKKYSHLFQQILENKLKNHYIGCKESGCTIGVSRLDEYDVAAGAASMFLEQLYAVPEIIEIQPSVQISWDQIFSYLKKKSKTFFGQNDPYLFKTQSNHS